MKRAIGLLSKLFGILVIIFFIINFVPTDYMLMRPGIAQELSPIITVEDGYKGGSKGDFMLTAVSTTPATIWDLLYINISRPEGVEIEPMEQHLPEGMDINEYLEIMEIYMEDSKMKSQAVAFEKAGYEVKIKEKGVIVNEILANGSAKGVLKKGDIIIAIDDKKVVDDQDAVELIRKHKIGEEVKITIEREGNILEFNLKTIETEENPGKASIGIMIFTNYDYQFPRKVYFNTKDIAGSSAGTMFALEIYNQLIPEDITGGRRIAGTGTISLDGTVGKIDGVQQKVIAAENNNADLFLVPEENYEEARKVTHKIPLVPVKSFDEILDYLEKTSKSSDYSFYNKGWDKLSA